MCRSGDVGENGRCGDDEPLGRDEMRGRSTGVVDRSEHRLALGENRELGNELARDQSTAHATDENGDELDGSHSYELTVDPPPQVDAF
jgi:hypothetical protein